MRGRKPKPTALKKLQGNPGGRRLNESEPQFSEGIVCPEWLTAEAKAEWARMVSELDASGMLQSVDAASLAGYCQSFARWRSAEQLIDREGQTLTETIHNRSGLAVGQRVRRHPATIIAKDEKAAMQKFAALFGFDPSSRSRIFVTPRKKKSELDAILDGDSESSDFSVN